MPRSDASPTVVGRIDQAILTENQRTRRFLCSDIGEGACLNACSDALPPRDHAECLLALRFGSDPEALGLARALYLERNTLLGVDVSGSIEGFRGQDVELFPALPIGGDRHHLAWLRASLGDFDGFIESITVRAGRPVVFEPRPRGFLFFRTSVPSYPSAYCSDGIIGYNLDGPLHADRRDMHETLFHELFHVNDARRGTWSERALRSIFDSILEQCAGDHDCFGPFAPHATIVPNGTYYAFDERTRDVREYAAELAVRYFLEHEALLSGDSMERAPFKCLTEENRMAWSRLVDEFFGGVDLSPECQQRAISGTATEGVGAAKTMLVSPEAI